MTPRPSGHVKLCTPSSLSLASYLLTSQWPWHAVWSRTNFPHTLTVRHWWVASGGRDSRCRGRENQASYVKHPSPHPYPSIIFHVLTSWLRVEIRKKGREVFHEFLFLTRVKHRKQMVVLMHLKKSNWVGVRERTHAREKENVLRAVEP